VGLVALALLARRQLITVQAHFAAVEQAPVAPGQPVLDPILPAGSLDRAATTLGHGAGS